MELLRKRLDLSELQLDSDDGVGGGARVLLTVVVDDTSHSLSIELGRFKSQLVEDEVMSVLGATTDSVHETELGNTFLSVALGLNTSETETEAAIFPLAVVIRPFADARLLLLHHVVLRETKVEIRAVEVRGTFEAEAVIFLRVSVCAGNDGLVRRRHGHLIEGHFIVLLGGFGARGHGKKSHEGNTDEEGETNVHLIF